jgi:transposase
VFLDESGFHLQPLNRRTWAPRGQTPVQDSWSHREKINLIGAVTLSPNRRRISTYFRVHDENICAPDVVAFVRHLHRQLQRPLILIWDRWPVHRSAAKRLTATVCPWLTVEWLPAYAPELNPVEPMWSQTKYADLANFVPQDRQDLEDGVVESLCDQRENTRIKRGYFHAAQLPI